MSTCIKGGDIVRNDKTGEERLVIEAGLHELTFSGSSKWESNKGWSPTGEHRRPKYQAFKQWHAQTLVILPYCVVLNAILEMTGLMAAKEGPVV